MKKFAVASCLLLGISVILAVSVASVEKGLPGSVVEGNCITICAGIIQKGYCKDGDACVFNAGACPTSDGWTCQDSVVLGYCGTATGAVNQSCESNSESPYICNTALPTQSCASVTTRCEQTDKGCSCGNAFGGIVPPKSGGVRTVC